MENDEVLMENDPLAIYLKNVDIEDFETAKVLLSNESNLNVEQSNTNIVFKSHEDLQTYFENIFKCELLLEEDYHVLETYFLNNPFTYSKKYLYNILFGSLSLTSIALFKYSNLFTKLLTTLCSVPLTINLYYFAKQKYKNRCILSFLNELTKLNILAKKCLRLVGEISTTINYYSSATINSSSINNVYIHFAKAFYSIFINIIKILAQASFDVISTVPLKIENNFNYGTKDDLFAKENINISDLKLLFELFMVIQSDFLKTLGLSFCSYLWSDANCDINKLITQLLPTLTILLKDKNKALDHEYTFLRNFGTSNKNDFVRLPKKFKNTPLNYMNTCLHNAELHFQQLICKTRDLQSIFDEVNITENKQQSEIILIYLNEIDKQISSSKNTIDAVIKYYNQLQNKTNDVDIKIPVHQPIVKDNLKTVENQEEELAKTDKQVYELYIPKEGLVLTELEIDSERPVFTMKDLDCSGVLFDELRTILRSRNPEVFQENHEKRKPEINSDSEDEEEFYSSRRRDIFRPLQPIGLAENLQTIGHVLAARQNMLQQCEEICGDTFESSDTEDAVIEN